MRVDALVDQLVLDKQFDRAAEFLEKCAEVGIVRDCSFGMFFMACQKVDRFDIAAEVACRWIESGMKGFRGHSANYLAYSGFLSGDVDRMLHMLRFMHNSKIPFGSEYPYSIAIHACNAHERWENALDVYCLFSQTHRRKGHIMLRNVLVTARKGDYRFLFRQLTDEILEKHEWISRLLLVSLMDSCKHFKDLDRAKAVFKAYFLHHHHVDSRCVNTLLSIYKDTARFLPLKECFALFERMGCRPDCFTFGLLLKSAWKTQQAIEVIDQILEEAKAWNVQLNSIITISACTAYRYAKGSSIDLRISRALDVLFSADTADQECYHLVMSLCMESGRADDALQVVKRMEAAGFRSNNATAQILNIKKRRTWSQEFVGSFSPRLQTASSGR